MKDVGGEEIRVYKMDVVTVDYSDVLGTIVSGTIDRPLGSRHPRHPEMMYPLYWYLLLYRFLTNNDYLQNKLLCYNNRSG